MTKHFFLTKVAVANISQSSHRLHVSSSTQFQASFVALYFSLNFWYKKWKETPPVTFSYLKWTDYKNSTVPFSPSFDSPPFLQRTPSEEGTWQEKRRMGCRCFVKTVLSLKCFQSREEFQGIHTYNINNFKMWIWLNVQLNDYKLCICTIFDSLCYISLQHNT